MLLFIFVVGRIVPQMQLEPVALFGRESSE